MKVARWRQAIMSRVVKRAASMLLVPPRGALKTPVPDASYNYTNTSSTEPPVGAIYSDGVVSILRINAIDANGISRAVGIQAIQIGATITVGTQSAEVTNTPFYDGVAWRIGVDAWPVLADGLYTVSAVNP